jgi:hypothetical protein
VITWIDRRLHGRGDDDGMGMILVIGTLVFISTLVAASGAIAINALTQGDQRVTYEQALATAENGVDFALGKLQLAFDQYNADWPTPSPPTTADPSPICNSATLSATATTDTTQVQEARTRLLSIAANPACRQKGGVGEYVVWKPPTPLVNGLYPKYGKVWAMGFVPKYDPTNPRMKTRMIKAEYLFMPYRPTNAVLTSGSLTIDSSTTVTTAYGVDPSLAAVHANGTVTVTNGNPSVTGQVSSTGTSTASSNNFSSSLNPGGVVATTPTQRIPTVSALSMYYRALNDHPEYASYWYDLCPNGDARAQSASGPCTSSTLLNSGNQGSFRGWTFDSASHVWTASNVTQDGIYFVHEGSVDVGPGNGTFNNFSVIAEAKNADNCASKSYGNINWDHFAISAPAFTNLFMYADSDIVTHSNFSAGQGISTPPVISGMFVAGDQIQLETSSAGAVGSVVAGDQCSNGNPDLITTDEVKNPAIYYDPNATAPFTSIISTTLWLEYPG